MSKTDYNTHLYRAISEVQAKASTDQLDNVAVTEDPEDPSFVFVSGPKVTFTIQSGPVNTSGRNGCDATDIIRYAIGLYRSFNSAFPCRENSCTITKLEEALHWQEARTRDRTDRGVEGSDNG